VDAPLRVGGLEPVVDPLPHGRRAGGGCRQDVALRTEAPGDAVVEDHAVLEAHHAVADAAFFQVLPTVDVKHLQELRHVGAAKVELA
jgi:hypothetical protein